MTGTQGNVPQDPSLHDFIPIRINVFFFLWDYTHADFSGLIVPTSILPDLDDASQQEKYHGQATLYMLYITTPYSLQ